MINVLCSVFSLFLPIERVINDWTWGAINQLLHLSRSNAMETKYAKIDRRISQITITTADNLFIYTRTINHYDFYLYLRHIRTKQIREINSSTLITQINVVAPSHFNDYKIHIHNATNVEHKIQDETTM